MIRHVKINLDATGFGIVEVDGQPIQNGVAGITLTSQPGHITTVSLDVHAYETTVEADADVTVAMTDGTRDALIALGWTPPKGDT